jgi:hypothetical protein
MNVQQANTQIVTTRHTQPPASCQTIIQIIVRNQIEPTNIQIFYKEYGKIKILHAYSDLSLHLTQ